MFKIERIYKFRWECVIPFLIFNVPLFCQTVYNGNIGTYPVEFVIEKISDSSKVQGVYMYTKHNEPILLSGTINGGHLVVSERDNKGVVNANIDFPRFNGWDSLLTGTWTGHGKSNSLPIVLKRSYTYDNTDTLQGKWENRELLQFESLNDYYFKLVIARRTISVPVNKYANWQVDSIVVTDVRIYSKNTGLLFQEKLFSPEKVNVFSRGINSISIDDYNFDGITDFSVYRYSGFRWDVEVFNDYFVFEPGKNRFENLGLDKRNLEFDHKNRTFSEYFYIGCCENGGFKINVFEFRDKKETFLEEHCYCPEMDTNEQKAKTGKVFYKRPPESKRKY